MKTARLLIVLLLLAWVSIDLAVWSAAARRGAWPEPAMVLLLSLAFGQSGLVALWGGLGRTPLSWRLAGILVVVAAWSYSLALAGAGGAAEHLALLLVQTLVVLAIVPILRADGRRFGEAVQEEMPRSRPPGGPIQFSLGDLLSWMTSTAIILGLLRATLCPEVFQHGAEFWCPIAWIAASHGAMPVAALEMIFGSRPWWARAALLAVSTLLCLLALQQTTEGPGLANVLVCFLQMLWLLAGLAVVRVAGFRLICRPAFKGREDTDAAGYCLSHSVSSCPIS